MAAMSYVMQAPAPPPVSDRLEILPLIPVVSLLRRARGCRRTRARGCAGRRIRSRGGLARAACGPVARCIDAAPRTSIVRFLIHIEFIKGVSFSIIVLFPFLSVVIRIESSVSLRSRRSTCDPIAHIVVHTADGVRHVHPKLRLAPLVGLGTNNANAPTGLVDVPAHARLEVRVAHALEARLDDALVDGLRRAGEDGREERPAFAQRRAGVVLEVGEPGGVTAREAEGGVR